MRILIIEDEKRLSATLADLLQGAGYSTTVTGDGVQGLELAKSGIYDGAVLDVMLPGLDGLSILKRLRNAHIMLPVLMLTARADLEDRIRGLDTGADYYLTKPFENEELLACLRAILRKSANTANDGFFFEDLVLTAATSTLSCGGRDIFLSAREFELMRLLIQNSSQFLPKETLLLKVWGYDSSVNVNSVEAYISFLRKKLSLLQSGVHITMLRGIGYRLEVTQ